MDERLIQALDNTWNKKAGTSSLERWLSICESEKWDVSTRELESLIRVFGASWYFTRFIYYRGIDIIDLFNDDVEFETRFKALLDAIQKIGGMGPEEQTVEQFRARKNEAMLFVLVNYLEERISQQGMEHALTCIADIVINGMIDLFGLNSRQDEEVLVLGMGRLAGYEMNYGSDLDMIFLAKSKDRFFEGLVKKTRKLLRVIALHDPSGYLYDIDMRLRPHGSSGTLITSVDKFIEFHQGDKEIWERQMMTRHRLIYGTETLREEFESSIIPVVYQPYSQQDLSTHIAEMRMHVEMELGRPKGKYEIKRGIGGIMDIDFLTHYFQLLYGYKEKKLQTCSTRNALQQIAALQLMDQNHINDLLKAYDYLKRVECALRVFDMKSISQFSSDPVTSAPLARAAGHFEKSDQKSTDAFLSEYQAITKQVRSIFNATFSLS